MLTGPHYSPTARLPRQKVEDRIGNTRRNKGTKVMVLPNGNRLPLATNHAEANLIEPLIDSAVTPYVPDQLIDDQAADSDSLPNRPADRDVELICQNHRRGVRTATQDRRSLRLYRRLWKIECSIRWLHAFQRLVTRYEFYSSPFHGFAKIAAMIIDDKKVLKLPLVSGTESLSSCCELFGGMNHSTCKTWKFAKFGTGDTPLNSSIPRQNSGD